MAVTNVIVELFYSGAWHDITATNDVYARDPIVITRGRADEVARIGPSTCSLTIENRDGRYSPRNPNSPLYGLIGRNTPIRVKVGSSIRFVGEVESWPQRWNVKGNDVWSPITANGILRRLNAAASRAPAYSALRRAITTDPIQPVAYWPLEGGEGSILLYDTVANMPTEQVDQSGAVAGQSGAVRFGSVALGDGSGLVANVAGSWTLGMPIRPVPTGTGAFAFQFALNYGVQVRSGNSTVVGLRLNPAVNTNHTYWLVYLDETGSGHVDVIVADGDLGVVSGPTLLTNFNAGNVFDGRPRQFEFSGTASGGAGVAWTLKVNDVTVATGTFASGITGVLNAGPWRVGALCTANADGVAAIGHVAVYTVASGFTARYQPVLGNPGEPAGDRIARLCGEEGIAVSVVDPPATGGELLGVQRPGTFVDLLNEAADSDGGILYETRDMLGLAYRTQGSLYSQTPALALNYPTGSEVAPPLDPVEDTDHVANDVTVTRNQGASARQVQETGALNVQEPAGDPDGIGRYRQDVTLSLAEDEQCRNQAGWRKHIGTWDEARYPVVNLDLAAMNGAGKTALAAAAAALDVGDRFTITNPPAWLPPESIDQLAQGFTEVIETHRWGIAVNATPAGPYTVAELNSATIGRLDATNSTLATGCTATDVGLSVAFVGAAWITTAAFGSQFPFDIMIEGERLTVTAIVNALPNQTFTVVRSVNGVSKSHLAGAPVHVRTPARLAR